MCTSIILKTKKNHWVVGRSNEFIAEYNSAINFVPRNSNHINSFGKNKINFPFKNKLSYLGLSMEGIIPIEDLIEDGINEKGLSVSLLYFDTNSYKEIELDELTSNNINYMYLTSYLLGNYSNVKEVKKDIDILNNKIYWEKGFSSKGFGIHITLTDKKGDSIVIEPENKKLILKENPLGVLTNSPSLEEHLDFLNKHLYLLDNAQNKDKPIKSLGNNLKGIPGDFSSFSRFVRASIFSSSIEDSSSIEEAVRNAFRILHTVDVIPGYLPVKVNDGKMKEYSNSYAKLKTLSKYPDSLIDYTDNFIVKDLSGLKMYYKTNNNISLRFIDLNKLKNETTRKKVYINKDNSKEFNEIIL